MIKLRSRFADFTQFLLTAICAPLNKRVIILDDEVHLIAFAGKAPPLFVLGRIVGDETGLDSFNLVAFLFGPGGKSSRAFVLAERDRVIAELLAHSAAALSSSADLNQN